MKIISKLMPVGRRSLLFGVHQFFWHPITVWLAWKSLYGRPTWRELVCIVIHDWGYWFTPNMDGVEGQKHPELGAKLAGWLFGPSYYDLVLLHSRHYAKLVGEEPSKLCWADKLSILYDPKYFYLLRAIASREIQEYRENSSHWITSNRSHGYWFDWIKTKFIMLSQVKRADATPFMYTRSKSIVVNILNIDKKPIFILYNNPKIMKLSIRKNRSQLHNWSKWRYRQ